MTALILLAILFLCGLLNSRLLSPKLIAWLRSLLPFPPSLNPTVGKPKPATKVTAKKDSTTSTAPGPGLDTVFATFDSDGDGFLTAGEIEESLRRLGLASSAKEVATMVERVDANGDGLIDLEEFRLLCDSFEREVDTQRENDDNDDDEEDLKEAFDVFDSNRDGLITVEELGLVLGSLGLRQGLKEEDCRAMIEKVDLDGDGVVNFEEFKQMMTSKDGKLF